MKDENISGKIFSAKQYATYIKTAVAPSETILKADITAFPEFNSCHVIRFVLFKFHSHFTHRVERLKNYELEHQFS